jgi:hypothetical protein
MTAPSSPDAKIKWCPECSRGCRALRHADCPYIATAPTADVRELCGQATALSALADRDGNYDLAMCLATLRDALSRLAAERERLEADAAHAWDRVERGDRRCEPFEAELAEIRTILAATDAASLPNDYPTTQMAADRIAALTAERASADAMLQVQVADVTLKSVVVEPLHDGSWRIYAPQSGLIEVKDCAGKWLASCFLKGGQVVIDGLPAQKQPD